MTQASSRRIFKSRWQSPEEVRELLQGIFCGELINPSKEIWLVSPWISDVAVIDNSAGGFVGLDPSWGVRPITLSEVFSRLLELGSAVNIVTRPVRHNESFLSRLKNLTGPSQASNLTVRTLEDLHEKGLLGDDFHLSGSMNLTYSGIEINGEYVALETDSARVADALISYRQHYGDARP